MDKHIDLASQALGTLGRTFTLKEVDLGADAHLKKSGMAFDTRAWEIEGIGHLCIMRMDAFLGLMRMETVVIAPTQVDLPLLNLDWVGALGTQTQMAELYDDQLSPWPPADEAVFHDILDRYGSLPNTQSSAVRWYDSILYSCSCSKKGKGIGWRLSALAQDYLDAFAVQLAAAPLCDRPAKAAEVRSFARRLFEEGGPAVDQVTRLFGAQTARRLVVNHMYGVRIG